jgi:HEAT repeat protein
MFALAFFLASLFVPASGPQPFDRSWNLLKAGIADKDPAKRAKAVHAVGLLKAVPQAQAMAEKALGDTNSEVRVEAATALGLMGADTARAKLRASLKDQSVKVVIACANALYLLKDPAAYDVYYTLLTGERKSKSGLLQSELDTLRDRKQVEKLAFETGIGFVPFGGMGYEAWKTITHDDTSPIRAVAAERLATDPDPKSADALIGSCTDKHWQVRAAVVNAIARRGDASLLDPVVILLDDENDSVRYDAAATIIKLWHVPKTVPRRATPAPKPAAAK